MSDTGEWHREMMDDILDRYAAEAAAHRPHHSMTVDPTYLMLIIERARQAPSEPRHKHRWAVFYAKCSSDRLALVCATGNDESCSELRYIDNLSPFTVPDA